MKKKTAKPKIASRKPERPPPLTTAAQLQRDAFEEAMRLFHAREFQAARNAFNIANGGPNREMTQRAQMLIKMCESRLNSRGVEPRTAEEHYNFGIASINTRDLRTAQQHLEAALEMEPQADHVYYAMALCRGLSGDLQGAYENLKRAIDLQPRNRITARQDADFATISRQPPINRLLFPEKARSV